MPPAETPDFDSMSPEEVMAWMESLAKRQGASEGFTTSADMEIAEIDPDSVQLDEPGYVPYGEESKPRQQAEPKAEAPAAAPEPEPEPVSEPVAAVEPEPEMVEEPPVEELAEDFEPAGMEWLESLAANQSGVFPEMDLSALTAAIDETEEEPEPVPTNPMSWLESLAESQGELDSTVEEVEEIAESDEFEAEPEAPAANLSDIEDPLAAGVDPMLWLESLARRQGARADELTTTADMDIPTPEEVDDSGPGYTSYTVEEEPPAAVSIPEETVDPAAWLESMAMNAEPVEADEPSSMSDEDIGAALSRGEDISPEQMEQFFNRQLDRGLARDEIPFEDDEDYDPEAPPVPAELPSWLLEQVQPPGDDETAEEIPGEAAQPALVDEIVEPPNVEDLPDWLKDDTAAGDDLSLESIFESTEVDLEIDTSDPWVQAFEEEAATDPDAVPAWYEQNVNDPDRIAAVERQLGGDAGELEQAALPEETTLQAGEPEAVPDWMGSDTDAIPAAEPLADIPDWLSAVEVTSEPEEMPNWLADADVDISPEEIPEWLRDTVETEEAEEAEVIIPAAQAEPEPAPAQPEPVSAAPVPAASAPLPVPAPAGDVTEALQSARSKAEAGDVEGSLLDYESIIRANQSLEHVVSDLTQLADQHKDQPAIYRVLGDGLMRQGKLQAAIDTYRKALNQL